MNSAIITADDWGLTKEINDGILLLARRSLVKRVSVLVGAKFWRHGLDELVSETSVEIGIHYHLCGAHSTRFSMRDTLTGYVNAGGATQFLTCFRLQLDLLQKAGFQPTYLDGHHHCHVFPGVLASIAIAMRSAGIFKVRIPYDKANWLTKYWGLNCLALVARQGAKRNRLNYLEFTYPKYSDFASPKSLHRRIVQSYGKEFLVHPSLPPPSMFDKKNDPWIAQRQREFLSLSDLADQGLLGSG